MSDDDVWGIVAFILMVLVFLFGVYGLFLDVWHGHIGWFIIDLCTSGITAVIRGIGYWFGYIAY